MIAIERERDSLSTLTDGGKDLYAAGVELLEQERVSAAAEVFQQALAFQPQSAATWNRFGVALIGLEDFAGAIACYERALALEPDFAGAYVNLGNAFLLLGNADRAMASYRNALWLNSSMPELHCNLGNAFKELGLWIEAETCYERSLALDSEQPAAHFNLATLLETHENFAGAGAHYHECMRLQPERELREMRPITMCPTVFADNAAIDQFRDEFLGDIYRFSERQRTFCLPELVVDGCAPPFNLAYQGRDDRRLKEAFASIYHHRIRDVPREVATNREGQPRIGFVVTRRHELAMLRCMGGVLDQLPLDLGEILVFCPPGLETALRFGFSGERVHVVPVLRRLDRMAESIRAAHLDVLYHWESGTDATNYLLPFLRLAPVQCTSWGIPDTSAIPEMDYYLSSMWLEGSDTHDHYTERLLCLDSLLAYYRRRPLLGKPRLPIELGPHAGRHVYLCAQYLGKFHPDFDVVLAGILRQDSRGVVAITAGAHPMITEKLFQRFRRVMPDVAERIVFLPSLRDADYLQLVAAVDVVLDPLHYGGATTIYDAFMLAQPVVTLPTQFQRGRYATAMYRRMGLDAGIANDIDDYIRRAVELASNCDLRQVVRQAIEGGIDSLLEDHTVVAGYTEVFRRLITEARGK